MCPEHLMNITCRPSCRVRLNWIVSLAFVYGTAVAWVVQGAGFLAGFATADITPPVGWRRAGGYAEFISTGVHDPLLAKAIVLSQSNTTVVLVRQRSLPVPRELTHRARQQVSAKTGIPAANIVITATINGHARVRSMDEPLRNDEDGDEPLTLHDCLAAKVDDPAMVAGRRLDWTSMLDSLDRTKKAILIATGGRPRIDVARLPAQAVPHGPTLHKVKLGRLIQACLGQDILVQAQARPGWRNTLDVIQERLTCRAERRAG